MENKTPQFNALLDEILEKLVPHERLCKWTGEHPHCEGKFKIEEEDISFLKMLRVPAPNYCPTCRRMRRFVHMNQSRFFKRLCNAPGHSEKMISILPEECPFPVYNYEYFTGDEFDPFAFGIKYDENKNIMESLLKLRKNFPMPSFLNRDSSSINSEYSNGGRNNKNTYYGFACFNSENSWYTGLLKNSRDIMDSRIIEESDHLYGGLLSDHIYKSSYIYFSNDCIDSMFLFDCRNCDSCFGCVNLRGAKYQIFNQQLSKEDYKKFLESISPLKRSVLREYEEKFWNLVKTLPMNASRNVAVENVQGVMLRNTRNVYDVIDADNSEHIRHVDVVLSHQDSMDILFSGGKSSLLYGTTNIGSHSSNAKFSVSSKFVTNSDFVFNSKNLDNCFMCFGLQNKSYCILNIQYSPEEYFVLVDKIKSKMLQDDEYGDGVGMEFSAQAYNFSMGQTSFPLTDEQIIKLGGYVAQESETNVGNTKILSIDEVPETIDEVGDDIINMAIECEVTGRPFRIIASELAFYRKMKLPLPTIHPAVRLDRLVKLAPAGNKYKVFCAKCHKSIESMFNPENKYILYCEDCFKKEVY